MIAATAMMGEKAAYACTAAVEEVIDEHYAAQIAALEDKDPALKEKIADFRADEAAHRETALKEGAEQAPAYTLLSETIKAGCRIAIMPGGPSNSSVSGKASASAKALHACPASTFLYCA